MLFVYFPDDAAWITYGYRTGRDVFCHYTSGSDHAVVTYGHSRQYRDRCSDPYVVADGYRPGIFQTFVSFNRVNRMTGGVESAVRGYEDIVAECHLGSVKDDEVEIGVEVFAYTYVVAIVAEEGLFDQD